MSSDLRAPRAATVAWSVAGLLRALGARRGCPAVIAFGEGGAVEWDGASLADRALRLAAELPQRGVAQGERVALCAPNSPAWIIAALAVLAAGCVLVPIDELADPEQLDAALTRCAAKLIFTEHHRETCANSFRKHRTEVILVDDAGPSAPPPVGWRVQLPDAVVEIPDRTDGPALLSRTSGTTGSPKAFVLTHRNIATNVEALSGLDLVGPEDRALLPLPMHHAYPFVVGMLTTLTIGTAIVLPKDVSGPEVNRAMREADVTAVVGVPRLYEALLSALELRVKGYGRIARLLWRGTLTSLILLQRATGLRPGRVALAPIRRAVAPHLRLLVSGGAQLQRATEEQLEALGWIVLSGYGLAETASLFTGNLPNARRFGSAGRPLADGAIRIAAPDPQGVGEIELYGSSITSGYLDNPEADRAAFTADGWFRTGDLGLLDQHGFLFVTGRTKEILVLAGGKKVVPEELENVYGAAPAITEVAVIEDKGRLVALVRPDAERLRQRGTTNFRDAVRVSLGETAQGLPSYERLSGFALTDRPLPRTRLGKIRRFLLPDLYAQALAGGGAHISRPLTPAETTLLSNPTAADVLEVVRQRCPARAIELDSDLGLDLGFDSFTWMEFATTLQQRLGIRLSVDDIAAVATVSDLLQLSLANHGEAVRAGEDQAVADMARWVVPAGRLLTILGCALHLADRLVMHGLCRLRISGIDNLPVSGPFVIAPNHSSYLDPLALAAALPSPQLARVYWTADALRFFPDPVGQLFCWAAHLFPVDAAHPNATVETALCLLRDGNIAIWFPEGWRSPDGTIQHFQPGIGRLLLRSEVPAVPVYIRGAFEAWPRNRRLPRPCRITVTFGCPVSAATLRSMGTGHTDEEHVASGLRERLRALINPTGDAASTDAETSEELRSPANTVDLSGCS